MFELKHIISQRVVYFITLKSTLYVVALLQFSEKYTKNGANVIILCVSCVYGNVFCTVCPRVYRFDFADGAIFEFKCVMEGGWADLGVHVGVGWGGVLLIAVLQ